MKSVFISGWATGEDIWRNVAANVPDPVYLNWNSVLRGDFTLPNPCVVTGWSMGGQLTMDLSARPEVKGMVLVSSMTSIARDIDRPGIEQERCPIIAGMLARSRSGYLTSFFRECGASHNDAAILLKESDNFPVEDLIAGLAVMFYRTAVPSPGIPSVVIHGTEDKVVPFEVAEHLSSSVLPGAKLISVPMGDHLLPLSNGDLIAKAVNDLAGCIGY